MTGKGNKQRIVPLQKEQITLLKQYIEDFGLDKPEREMSPPVFQPYVREIEQCRNYLCVEKVCEFC